MIIKIENSTTDSNEHIIGLRQGDGVIHVCEIGYDGTPKYHLLTISSSGKIQLWAGLVGSGYPTDKHGRLLVEE